MAYFLRKEEKHMAWLKTLIDALTEWAQKTIEIDNLNLFDTLADLGAWIKTLV
jgi:hypothetical protein